MTDGNGNPVKNLPASAIGFKLAKLMPGTDGNASAWHSYVNVRLCMIVVKASGSITVLVHHYHNGLKTLLKILPGKHFEPMSHSVKRVLKIPYLNIA